MDIIVKVDRFTEELHERLAAMLEVEWITQEEHDQRASKVDQWVLGIDPVGERFLLIHDTKFEWVPMADCKLSGADLPDAPKAVFVVKPQSGLSVVRGSGLPPGKMN